MKRVVTATPLAQWLSADANTIQDRALGIRGATKNNGVGVTSQDTYGILWQATSDLATATLRQLDDSIDWRDRIIWGDFVELTDVTEMPGGSTDYAFNSRTYGANRSTFVGYTGIGAYSNITTGAAVANGSPPLNNAGTFRSYYVNANDPATHDIRIYVDPSTGSLYVYNNSGSTIQLWLFIKCSGDLGLR